MFSDNFVTKHSGSYIPRPQDYSKKDDLRLRCKDLLPPD